MPASAVLWACCLAVLSCCVSARAQESAPTDAQRNPAQVILFHQHAEDYKGGRQLAVTVYVSAFQWDGLTAMGLYETVPEGWTFGGVRAITGTMPGVTPGNGDTGVLQFLWIEQSTAPITFQYVLNIPPRDSGTRFLSGQVEYRQGEGALTSNVAFSQMTGVADALPVIALRGNSGLKISLNDTFNDPGATASDTEDGDLSNRIEVAGTVDTGEPGTYALSYGVVDSVGNRAVPVTRQVTVSESPSEPGGTTPDGEKPGQGGGIGTGTGAAQSRPGRMAKNSPESGGDFPPIAIPDITLRETAGDYPLPLKTGDSNGEVPDTEAVSGEGPGGNGAFRAARAAEGAGAANRSDPNAAPGAAGPLEDRPTGAAVTQSPLVLIGVALLMGVALIALWRQSRRPGRRPSPKV